MSYLGRHIEDVLRQLSRSFKIVLVAGARQVGKSTLLQHVFPETKHLVFDPVQDLYGARNDPDQFLATFPAPLILDEIQYAPELLPALKRRVDQSPAKGQYLLTGSQNLAILRNIAESLAGRVAILRLDGMTPAELVGQAQPPSWLSTYLDDPDHFFDRLMDLPRIQTPDSLCRHLWRGQFPALAEMEDEHVPTYMSAYIQTYVERDVRLMADLADLTQFGRFLRLAGAMTGQEIFQSQFGRDLGINPKTARRWLNLLLWSYQWIEFPCYSGNSIKRLSNKPKGHLQDTGLACYLNAIPSPESLLSHPHFGNIFESWGVGWLHRQAQRLRLPPVMYHWRTQNGAEVDAVLEYNGRLYPIEFKAATNLNKHDTRGIRAFQETYPQAAPGIIVYGGQEPYRLSDTCAALPWLLI